MRAVVMSAATVLLALLLGAGSVNQSADAPVAARTGIGDVSARAAAQGSAGASQTALPRAAVDVREPATSGRTIHVAAGESLQAALNEARPGDRITLEAGASYEGPFRLPKKTGEHWIVVASNRLDQLPPGRRVNPSDARHMAKLVGASRSAIVADSGAHHYRFAGLEIAPGPGEFLYNLIELGGDAANLTEIPHHVVFDRTYIHGDSKMGGRRGIAMNGRDIAVVNSHFSDFKEVGADSQAIGGWNGPGPFRIENSYLEAAGENVMFGGADPAVNGLVPSDIQITGNHFTKPLRWKVGDASYAGTPWAVKNLFELKNARRVLVEGNLFEHNWPHAQNGFAILFTPRNQEGGAPWSGVEDVTFRGNVVRRVAAGINILGRDDNHESRRTRNIVIQGNLFTEIGGAWGGNGRLFQLLNGTAGVTIVNNTAERTAGGMVFGGDHDPHTGFVFRNNVMPDNGSGFIGSGTAPGKSSIERYFPGAVITGNVFAGGRPEHYPPGNHFARQESPGAGADARLLAKIVDEVAQWPN